MDQEKLNEIKKFLSYNSLKNNERFVLVLKFAVALAFALQFALFWGAPQKFPTGSMYNLKEGYNLTNVANDLKADEVIKSVFWFKASIYILGQRKIIAGDYTFDNRESVFVVAWRLSHGDFETKSVKITIPEGLNSFEIAQIYENNLPFFHKDEFLNLVKTRKLEGYLFPDTYFFMPSASAESIVELMNANYKEKIASLEADIKKFGKSESDVIKMASILEEEARLYESRQIVAGILWKRLSLGMALQVDSSFKYINGKTTKDLTLEDLKIESPYNSYTHKGLPPTPISNPGLSAIKAAINPIKTKYFYFLTDKDGNMHYAVTLEEHTANKFKYLR